MLRILLIVAFAAVLLLASCVKDIEGDEEFTGAVKASRSPVAVDVEAPPADAEAEEAEGDELVTDGDEAADDAEDVDAEDEAEEPEVEEAAPDDEAAAEDDTEETTE